MRLTWTKCPCGHSTCSREFPEEIGTFSSGSGFDPEDKQIVEQAFERAALFPKMLDVLERVYSAEFSFGVWPDEDEIKALIEKAGGEARI